MASKPSKKASKKAEPAKDSASTKAKSKAQAASNPAPTLAPLALADVQLLLVGAPAGFVINNDGTVQVPAGAAAGAVTFDYQICEIAAPTNCAGGHRDRRASVATANAASRHRLRRVRYSLSECRLHNSPLR